MLSAGVIRADAGPSLMSRHKIARTDFRHITVDRWEVYVAESEKDAGMLTVLVERFEKQRLPRALALREKVEKGELLDEWDTTYLEEVMQDAREVKALVDKHPEYQDLYARAVHLHKEITDKALENAKNASSSN